MKLLKSTLTAIVLLFSTQLYATTYEDGTGSDNWSVYDKSPSGASIDTLCDKKRDSEVIALNGAGTQNGYILGNLEGRDGAWNNTTDKTIQWHMKFEEAYVVYIRVMTTKGARYIFYTNHNKSYAQTNKDYIHIGLGKNSSNGTWQSITRDLEKDLRQYEPDNTLTAVNAFLVRGNGFVDNISLSSDKPSKNKMLPIDSNIELGQEENILYYVDPRPEEGGENRALRINTATMNFEEINVDGINPHSIDRAGDSNNFYIRTQDSNSFDIVNFKENTTKTISLGDHSPRAIGAYNDRYKLQLLSAKNMPIVDIIDTTIHKIIKTVGERQNYDKTKLTSNAGNGSATGHSFWLDEDHFVLIDRVNKQLKVYRVSKNSQGFVVKNTDTLKFLTALHAVDRVNSPTSKKDLRTFYALGEGDSSKSIAPFVSELVFYPRCGRLQIKHTMNFIGSKPINNVKPTTHHASVSPDGKYLVVPVFDEKVCIINKNTMKIVKTLQAKLGAAHVEFSKKHNLAIITNHFSPYLTIIDMNTLTVKKHLEISHHKFDPKTKHLLQPHFSYVSKDGNYFYTFATQDGNFLKIDLKTLKIVETLHTGGAPEQAHS